MSFGTLNRKNERIHHILDVGIVQKPSAVLDPAEATLKSSSARELSKEPPTRSVNCGRIKNNDAGFGSCSPAKGISLGFGLARPIITQRWIVRECLVYRMVN